MRSLHAFSIVELLTALVLLAVGLAAFARAAAAVARLDADARLTRAVAEAMQARLDSLALACSGARGGEAHGDGISERWFVLADSGHLTVIDTIVVPSRPRLTRGMTATVRCTP